MILGRKREVRFVVGRGDGSFAEPVSFGGHHPTRFVYPGDFLEDGRMDLLVTGSRSGDSPLHLLLSR